MSRIVSFYKFTAISSLLALASSPALAQIEEIVVTAQKRADPYRTSA